LGRVNRGSSEASATMSIRPTKLSIVHCGCSRINLHAVRVQWGCLCVLHSGVNMHTRMCLHVRLCISCRWLGLGLLAVHRICALVRELYRLPLLLLLLLLMRGMSTMGVRIVERWRGHGARGRVRAIGSGVGLKVRVRQGFGGRNTFSGIKLQKLCKKVKS